MDSLQNTVLCYRFKQSVIYMLLLLSSFSNWRLIAEGRAIPSPAEASQQGIAEVKVIKGQIGSRPPRCDRKCITCGHCQAIQVPVSPIIRGHAHENQVSTATSTIAYSRGDGISNYKPMSWKCKCGDLIFNP